MKNSLLILVIFSTIIFADTLECKFKDDFFDNFEYLLCPTQPPTEQLKNPPRVIEASFLLSAGLVDENENLYLKKIDNTVYKYSTIDNKTEEIKNIDIPCEKYTVKAVKNSQLLLIASGCDRKESSLHVDNSLHIPVMYLYDQHKKSLEKYRIFNYKSLEKYTEVNYPLNIQFSDVNRTVFYRSMESIYQLDLDTKEVKTLYTIGKMFDRSSQYVTTLSNYILNFIISDATAYISIIGWDGKPYLIMYDLKKSAYINIFKTPNDFTIRRMFLRENTLYFTHDRYPVSLTTNLSYILLDDLRAKQININTIDVDMRVDNIVDIKKNIFAMHNKCITLVPMKQLKNKVRDEDFSLKSVLYIPYWETDPNFNLSNVPAPH